MGGIAASPWRCVVGTAQMAAVALIEPLAAGYGCVVEPPVGIVTMVFTDIEGSTRLAAEPRAFWGRSFAVRAATRAGAAQTLPRANRFVLTRPPAAEPQSPHTRSRVRV
jgi:hypothetical protein